MNLVAEAGKPTGNLVGMGAAAQRAGDRDTRGEVEDTHKT